MKIKRLIYLNLTLIMAIIIFLFSSQESAKSNNLSYSIDIKIFNLINNETEETVAESQEETEHQIDNAKVEEEKDKLASKYPVGNKQFHDIDSVVRKSAHVLLYTLFAISLALFVKTYEIKNWKVILIVLVVGFLYACLDEFNQKIRGTRSGLFSDCLIDTAGCLIGVMLWSLSLKIQESIMKKTEKS